MRALTSVQLRHLEEKGYLVVKSVLDPERDLARVMSEYDKVLDKIADALFTEGKVKSTYRSLTFDQRLIRICVESGKNFPQHFDISLPQSRIRHDTPMHVGPAVFHMLTNPRLLDVVEDVLGPEIYSNPVQHVRMKLPKSAVAQGRHSGLVARVPWHQDNGVILEEADHVMILTVWCPITKATVENGCMRVIPRSHRGNLVPHCPTDEGVAIPEKLIPAEAVLLPMKPGSVLLMHQRTIHSSLDNITGNQVRISFDLRYQTIGQPTGRPQFPGFVARSKVHPELVLRDPVVWAQSWYEARARLAAEENLRFNRWRADERVCA